MKLGKKPSWKNFLQESCLFLGRALRNPLGVGSFFPSSRGLSRMVADYIAQLPAVMQGGYVIEIGPGTGSFTKALLDCIPKERIVCIEIDDYFAQYLRKRFVGIEVIQGDASILAKILPAYVEGKVACVVSGIPMRNLSLVTRKRIVENVFDTMGDKGEFVQFTYLFRAPLKIQGDDTLCVKRVGYIWRNIPPATLWSYSRDVCSRADLLPMSRDLAMKV
jgi:phosphatidylethanolamine/phosphatidyl-N-methylethanolamine N-methyltransferase